MDCATRATQDDRSDLLMNAFIEHCNERYLSFSVAEQGQVHDPSESEILMTRPHRVSRWGVPSSGVYHDGIWALHVESANIMAHHHPLIRSW